MDLPDVTSTSGASAPLAPEDDAVISTASADMGFSGRRTAEIVGITYRQLDYWARTDLVKPSLADARGSGSRRLYSYRDLLELKVIKTLLDAGLKLESVRQVFSYMRQNLGEDITAANLVISGTTSVLVRSGEELIDVLQRGQGVLNVLPLAGVKEEIDARIVEFPPTGKSSGAVGQGARSVSAGGAANAAAEASNAAAGL
ncbi:MAG: MerR family transcriptional regulator [Microthrixaceae bacterium]